jgi:hypothetical protein
MERRRGKRQEVPELYREYISLKIRKSSNEWMNIELLDFSQQGIRIMSPFALSIHSTMDCLVSAPQSLSKEVHFVAKIIYCMKDDVEEDYLVGAEIMQSEDELWLDLFSKVHDFIKERIGKIY